MSLRHQTRLRIYPTVNLICLVLLLTLTSTDIGKGTARAEQFAAGTGFCQQISKPDEPIDLGNTYREIHIRQNIPGQVSIRDSGKADGRVMLTLKKVAATKNDILGFTSERKIYKTPKGEVWVLLLDYHRRPVTVSLKVIVGCVIAFVTLCVLIGLCAWCCVTRKRRAEFSLIRERNRQLHYQGSQDTSHFPPAVNRTDLRGQRHKPQGCLDSGQLNEIGRSPEPTASPRIAGSLERNQLKSNHSHMKDHGRGSKSAVKSAHGLPRSSVMLVSMVAVISVVYANCSTQPWAEVIIDIPRNSLLDAVRVFGNKDRKVTLESRNYMRNNKSRVTFQVFDVDDEAPSEAEPCFARDKCIGGDSQDLAGCDPISKKCICQRGYELVKDICYDIDECKRGQFDCPGGSTCKNIFGSYICQCPPNYFLENNKCKECSYSCPVGQYESQPCAADRDRVCQDCSVCTGSSYEAGACNGISNSHCLHVAYPLLVKDQPSFPAYREGMRVETSSNVFSEDLHNTGNLDTTHYITDIKQSSDFYWDRESGLRVNIGVEDVNLVPEYEDVQHSSDNLYMMDNPRDGATKSRFKEITEKYCRHPIPDHYSVTLEIARDRTTSAKKIICDSKNPDIPKCPDHYRDGDFYIFRTLNDACEKMGTFPKRLKSLSNSFVCTEDTALLRFFNQTYSKRREIRFPPRRCKNPILKCKQCLSQARCPNDHLEASCCRKECYTKPECKESVSPKCAHVPVECAMGDAYVFMIIPVFTKLQSEFQCHLRYKKPKKLYTLFFYVTLKEGNFKLPRVERIIYNKGIDFQSRAEYKQDYATIEHNSGIALDEDVIIIGSSLRDNPGKLNYSIFPMKTPEEFGNGRPAVNMFSTTILAAEVQFESPFAYSTALWQKSGGCDKNITKFRQKQPLYRADPQTVNADIDKQNGGFKYHLQGTDKRPYIRFSVPGNFSILYWYFKNNGPVLYANESLRSSLTRSTNGKIWTIFLAARMSDCPAYLGIIINDRSTHEELFKYDLLIRCPASFNISFKVPNFGLDKERVFEVLLQDSMRQHTIYLNHLDIPEAHIKIPHLTEIKSEPENKPLMSFIVIGLIVFCVLVVFLLAHCYIDCTRPKTAKYLEEVVEVHRSSSHTKKSRCCYPSKNINRSQFVFVILYAVYRILYSLIFTFSVTMAIALLVIHEDLLKLSTLPAYQRQKKNETLEKAVEINRYREMETLRQIKLATRMQSACNHYIQGVFVDMKEEMHNITWQNQVNMFEETTSVSAHIQDLINDALIIYRSKIANFTRDYIIKFDQTVKPALVRYQKFLEGIFENGWFDFSRKLYNSSSFNTERPLELLQNDYLQGEAVNFLSFLELEPIESVQLMPLKFWKRYQSKQPVVEEVDISHIKVDVPGCEFVDSIRKFSSADVHKNTLNTFRFFPLDPDSEKTRQLFREEGFWDLQDYEYILPGEGQPVEDNLLLHLQDVFQSFSLKMLLYFFLLLDAMVLIYRCTNTYSTIQMLYNGFEERLSLSTAASQKQYERKIKATPIINIANQHNKVESSKLSAREGADTEEKTIPLIERTETLGQRYSAMHLTYKEFTYPSKKACFTYALKLIRTKVIVVILAACLIGVVSYLVVNITLRLVTVDSLYHYGGFGTYLGGLDVQLEHTNSFVRLQAEHLNSVTMEIYKQQMRAELQSLQSMMEHFNLEQEDVVASYIAEICAVRLKLLGEFADCDMNISPNKLHLQFLPCNFIPIDAYPYKGYDRTIYISNLRNDFIPFTVAAQNIVLKTLNIVIINIICMYLLHLGGHVVFHFLKTRHKFPVHRIYLSMLPPSDHELQRPTESDSDEAGFQHEEPSGSSSKHRKSPETLAPSSSGYSETKV